MDELGSNPQEFEYFLIDRDANPCNRNKQVVNDGPKD